MYKLRGLNYIDLVIDLVSYIFERPGFYGNCVVTKETNHTEINMKGSKNAIELISCLLATQKTQRRYLYVLSLYIF